MNGNYDGNNKNEKDVSREISAKINVCAISGFVLSVVTAVLSIILLALDSGGYLVYAAAVPFVSLILSIIGTAKARGNRISKVFGIVGIVISAIIILIILAALFLLILFIQACGNATIAPKS